jgi:ATP-dependent DNA ligase
VPAGESGVHESKLDRYRQQVVKCGGKIHLSSRRGNVWTSRLPVLAEALTAVPASAVILDAELSPPC